MTQSFSASTKPALRHHPPQLLMSCAPQAWGDTGVLTLQIAMLGTGSTAYGDTAKVWLKFFPQCDTITGGWRVYSDVPGVGVTCYPTSARLVNFQNEEIWDRDTDDVNAGNELYKVANFGQFPLLELSTPPYGVISFKLVRINFKNWGRWEEYKDVGESYFVAGGKYLKPAVLRILNMYEWLTSRPLARPLEETWPCSSNWGIVGRWLSKGYIHATGDSGQPLPASVLRLLERAKQT